VRGFLGSAAGERSALFGLLVVLGAGWGITQPLTKLAVSTGHGHFGLIFWQLVIGAVLMAVIALATRRRLPLTRQHPVPVWGCGEGCVPRFGRLGSQPDTLPCMVSEFG
jgi:drug/metabolite transporter (DMT)-like permease